MIRPVLRSSVRTAGVFLIAAALGLGACQNSDKDTSAAASETKVQTVNTVCPVGGHDFDKGSRTATTTRTHKGQTIGFCCPDCVEAFDTMTAAEKDGVLKLAQANKSE